MRGLALSGMNGKVSITNFPRNHIDATIILEGELVPWKITGFYSHSERNKHRESWQLLIHISTLNILPWLLMGDFNDISSSEEKKGRYLHP